jgi:hypothetical protein
LSTERNFHEGFDRAHGVVGSSDRSFGFTIAGVLALLGVAGLLAGKAAIFWLVAAFVLAVLAVCAPGLLAPFNRLWLKLGTALYRIVNPLVMAVLFFALITPMALLLRLIGRRPLRLRWEPEARSYWLARDPPGPAAETMDRQY